MERGLAVHAVIRATKDMADTIVENDSDAIEQKLHPLRRSVVKSLPKPRREIKHVLASLNVLTVQTKTDIEEIVETQLVKWTSTVHLKILNGVESSLEEVLQASYFILKIGVKAAMINLVE